MNAIGQLILYGFTIVAYFVIFATTAPLLGRILLKVYNTGYWMPVILGVVLGLLGIIHHFVAQYIDYSLDKNTGAVLARNIGRSAVLLIAAVLYAFVLHGTGLVR